jgi:formyltetrahydrofolate deformylase
LTNTAILLAGCPDQRGIEASIADFIFRGNRKILCASEHQDREQKLFSTAKNGHF